MKVYKKLAQTISARNNCSTMMNDNWLNKHQDTIDSIMSNAPRGCGFDSGTTIITDSTTDIPLAFETSYHHMNENGMYDGWTDHTVKVVPDLQFDFILKISGKNRNDIKDYIYQVFEEWLNSDCPE